MFIYIITNISKIILLFLLVIPLIGFNNNILNSDEHTSKNISGINLSGIEIDTLSSNLPLVIIDTHGQEISDDDPRISCYMGIISNSLGIRNNTNDIHNDYTGQINIEIRGQSSSDWAKKSYSLETQNEADSSNRNVSLLGMPEENDWVLYAPYYDRSFIRNVLTYNMSRGMGMYASRTRYCELILNDKYMGIYILMEKIKRSKNRVNISKLSYDEISGDELTGGYILEIDRPQGGGFESTFPPANGNYTIRYNYKYPKENKIVAEQMNYIQNYIFEFEEMMMSEDFADSFSGYTHYINTESFIDYIILNEITRNADAYRLSVFLYKDKESLGGRLTVGPPWDYNFSFGNVGFFDIESDKVYGWNLVKMSDAGALFTPFWWIKLFSEEEFFKNASQQWWELRQTILDKSYLFSYIDSVRNTLDEAQQRNFEIWPGPGDSDLGPGYFPPDFPIKDLETYDDEINFIKDWLDKRIDWLDENFLKISEIHGDDESMLLNSFWLQQNYPNPFNQSTTINFTLPEQVNVKLCIYNSLGEEVVELINENMTAGYHSLKFDASNFSSCLYFYKITAGNFVDVKKMILLK